MSQVIDKNDINDKEMGKNFCSGPKVSIIIPVYKVEKYLPECLNSVLAQTFQNWEAICVNDGSPDGCGKILAEYARKDDRIKVISQANQGVSVARNTALKAATGEYFCFLDSDDLLHPDFLKILLEALQKYDVKVIGADFQMFKETYTPAPVPSKFCEKYYENPLFKYLSRKMKYNAMVWGKLYHKSIFQGMFFEPDLSYGEDTHLSMKILSKIHEIVFLCVPLYAYRESEASLSRSPFNTKMIDDHILSFLKLNDFFEKSDQPLKVRKLARRKLANRCFRWLCVRTYKQNKENYQEIWEKYLPVINDLIQGKKLSLFDLAIRYWPLFYLWRHKHWKALTIFL